MKNTCLTCFSILLFVSLITSGLQPIHAQSGASAVLDTASLNAQLDYIHEKTRVYEDYRAIREDIFLKLKKNVQDTLSAANLELARLNSLLTEKDLEIETLNTDLARTNNEKDEAIKNKNSLSLLGIQMNKALYSTILWLIILALVILSAIMVMLFKRTHQVTNQVKDELEHIREEFEEYRKNSREKYEKLVVSHHSEIMKLKNS
jgi:hypothetical protein